MGKTVEVHGVPFRRQPRPGQMDVFNMVLGRRTLNVKLPTGYGKTFAACGVYSILKRHQDVNRALFIFPTDGQFIQFCQDGPSELQDAGVSEPLGVVDVCTFGRGSLYRHQRNMNQVYAITIQSLIQPARFELVQDLMRDGRWLVVVDEYHHYGMDAAWGQTVNALNYWFRLAMSATPGRPKEDSAVGPPDVQVRYRKAVEEKSVKPLTGHSYNYRIETIGPDGSIRMVTTDQLVAEAGGDSADKIEKMMITRQMRWSPDYIGPLVSHPLERLLVERIKTGYRLQAIIGAMCVSHAEMVCEQVRTAFPDLEIDWVGTGEYGRSQAENREVLNRFCPPKDFNGYRSPTLDVLVHVGMAGEGLDATHVSEVIHLNNAAINNSNNQENGRAARYLPGVTAHINFDSTSDFATGGYVGRRIELAMDELPADAGNDPDEPPEPPEGGDPPPLPPEPTVHIWRMELDSIDSGDPEVQRMARALAQGQAGLFSHLDSIPVSYEEMIADLNHPAWDRVKRIYLEMRAAESRQHNERSEVSQLQDNVKNALTTITTLIARRVYGTQVTKAQRGLIKKNLNRQKCHELGPIEADPCILRVHYEWLQETEAKIRETNLIPGWALERDEE